MLRMYGSSDDLVCVEGVYEDEFQAGDVIVVGQSEPAQGSDSQGLLVRFAYAPRWVKTAVWVAELSPMDEGSPIPWRIEMTQSENGYSAQVQVHCPAETPVTVRRDGKVIWRNGEWLGES